MALDNYANLLASVGDWFADTTLSSQMADAVTLLEAELNRSLRVRRMENLSTSTTTVAGTQSYAWPTGFLECRSGPYIVQSSAPNRVLQFVTPSALQEMDDGRGNDLPAYWSDYMASLYLFPKPVAGLTIHIPYYKKLALATDTTNWLLSNHPDVYLYGTLMQMGTYETESERLALWASRYATGLKGVMDEDKRVKGGTQPARVMADTMGP